ncbi:MAG: Two-component transcriptional response regulator, LuxR family [uncultured Rubrobacteraceae bacterium]|uniref:Two-component transcriptional response regulator, LuxR family n=1 Tax=uncultured Rubrobacteraceae bacterium TaxID=349277 RepID=A0A6J4NK59_9ACTN|nr:MAG: Two-component transcriptional response regulator, LuxR family [uncultured Rubrobacteraceae bacterium]
MPEASKPEASKIRVLVAEDHAGFRHGLVALLASDPGVEVVGEAEDGRAAVAMAVGLLPDVVLMDVQMPGLNGIEATRAVLAQAPRVGVLVLTMFEDDDSIVSAMRAGARGYVLKSAAPSEVMGILRSVAGGEARFGPQIASKLTGFLREPEADPTRAFPELTAREREILDLIARGHDNAGISGRLFLSPNTVRNHISRVFAKLGVASRAQAIVRAREAGLGRDGT